MSVNLGTRDKQHIAIYDSWTNDTWDTFGSTGMNITSAIEAEDSEGEALSNYEPLVAGTIIYYKYNLTLNYGSDGSNNPVLVLYREGFGEIGDMNILAAFNGTLQNFPAGWVSIDGNYRLGFRSSADYPQINCSCDWLVYK